MSDPGVRTALSRGPCPSVPALAVRYLEEFLEKIRRAVAIVDDEEIWGRPPGGNSAGNLILHLCGNISLWIGQGLGGVAYDRDRSGEFAAERTHGRDDLVEKLAAVVARSCDVLAGLDEEDLTRRVDVQTYETDVLGVIFHVVEHMSYHTGQIVFLAKQARGAEHGLELYPRHSGE